MITKKLVDKIEGEASVYFDIKDKLVDFATVSFSNFRGIEGILENKNALDALVITPRVCGICGHAHLMATVRAIEDSYKNAGHAIILNEKIEKIREFTLLMEIIQNHFKWIYLTIIPEIQKLGEIERNSKPLKGAFGASITAKAIAILAGQWPHSSYMLPGGISSDPTNIDILKAQSCVDELIYFFEKESLGVDIDEFLAFESCKDFEGMQSDISFIEKELVKNQMIKKGFSHGRFIVLGEHTFTQVAKLKQTRATNADIKYIDVVEAYSPHEKSYAKNALYKRSFYEAGPLARCMALNMPIIKNMHRRYKDSAYSRVMARIFELAYLLKKSQSLLENIDISQNSFLAPPDIKSITAEGVGVVEAPRGPLIHKIKIERGIIKSYQIITPTQFNIGSSKRSNPTPVQQAMIGVSPKEALFIFRTFDVCSVCTTH